MPKLEWDPAKAASKLDKHGVSFETARKAFADWSAIERVEDDPDETRFMRLGMAEGHVLFVVYTERRNVIRIISARKATKHEQESYFKQAP